MSESTDILRNKLAAVVAQADDSPLKFEVCSYILDHYDDDSGMETFFRDLAYFGCVSGMVSGMVYYDDTHAFFDRHYDEIEELRVEAEEALGESLRLDHDLKNSLAWFGFEETAFQIARDDLSLEI